MKSILYFKTPTTEKYAHHIVFKKNCRNVLSGRSLNDRSNDKAHMWKCLRQNQISAGGVLGEQKDESDSWCWNSQISITIAGISSPLPSSSTPYPNCWYSGAIRSKDCFWRKKRKQRNVECMWLMSYKMDRMTPNYQFNIKHPKHTIAYAYIGLSY